MRQIKFRAWIYGLGKMTPVKEIDFDGYMSSVMVEINSERHEQMFFENTDYPDCELMQYTGLKDKNGVEIYEGDILRNVDNPFVDKLPFEVKWNEYYGAWFWWSLLGEAGTDYLHQGIAKNCEVIGSIYENPEGDKK